MAELVSSQYKKLGTTFENEKQVIRLMLDPSMEAVVDADTMVLARTGSGLVIGGVGAYVGADLTGGATAFQIDVDGTPVFQSSAVTAGTQMGTTAMAVSMADGKISLSGTGDITGGGPIWVTIEAYSVGT